MKKTLLGGLLTCDAEDGNQDDGGGGDYGGGDDGGGE